MTPKDLKNSILQLAIQGKLVEQRAEEGTAEELHLKLTPYITKLGPCKHELDYSSMDFEVPSSWKMMRLNEIVNFIDYRGKTPTKVSEGVFLITASNIKNGYMDYTRKEYISLSEYEGRKNRGITKKGDLLFTTEAPMGNAALCDLEISSCGQRIITFQQYEENTIDLTLLMYFILSPSFQGQLSDNCTGTTAKGIKAEKLKHFLIPLPPLAEQKRIVAKIEEILPLIDRYEKAWTRLEAFNRRFPGDLQKSILQLAIQGKLVEQRAEEGTAEELYREIQREKQALIRAGKIKKEKALPEISEEEIPFEIPEGWIWVRLGEVFNIINGFTPLKSNPEFWENGDIPWFTIDDVHRQGRFISKTEKFITRKALSKNTERIVPPETVLLCCTASVGEYAYTKIPLTTNQQFNALVVKEIYKPVIFPLYIYMFVQTLKATILQKAGKTTFNFLSVGKLSEFLIPLPPLAEQKRIVAKIEELLPLCERLKLN